MDVPKEFENKVWPSIRDDLPRGKKTNALYDIENKIRGTEDSSTVKKVTWEIIEQYFGPKIISEERKEIINKKIDKLF